MAEETPRPPIKPADPLETGAEIIEIGHLRGADPDTEEPEEALLEETPPEGVDITRNHPARPQTD